MNSNTAKMVQVGLRATASIEQMLNAKLALENELRESRTRLMYQRQGNTPSVSIIESEVCALKGRIRYLADRMVKQGVTHA